MAFSMFSGQLSPVAIDFGSSSVKLLQIDNGGDKPSLVAAAEIEVPEEIRGNESALIDFYGREIPRAFRHGRFKGKRVVSALPSGRTLVQHMQVPAFEGASLEDAIKGQLQIQMGCAPQSIVVRALEVPDVHRKGQAGRESICFAATRETVMRYVEMLRRCKLETVGMHTETMAMVRAFDHLNRRADDLASTTLYADLGWSGTRVAITHGRHIRFARYIPFGGRQFDQAIAASLTCDLAAARAKRLEARTPLKPMDTSAIKSDEELPEGMAVLRHAMTRARGERHRAAGGDGGHAVTDEERRVGVVPSELRYQVDPDAPAGAEIGVNLAEPLETIADELSMSLRYHRALFPDRAIDRVIFLGGEARQLWLCQHLIRELRLPAQLGDPLARLAREGSVRTPGLALDQPQPGWAVACGLCIAPTDL